MSPLIACATAGTLGPRGPLTGVRFTIGTAELPAPARGALGMFDGRVEFAAGRGRVDVIATHYGPPIAVQSHTLAPPLASAGDYYLFGSTGFVLVRPASRTFSTFVLSESSYRLVDVPEPREGFMEFSPLHADTLTAYDSTHWREHGPFTVRWHLDRRQASGPSQVLARGWIELPDAPASDASVIRWFGAAATLARLLGNPASFPTDSPRVTAAIVLPPSGRGASRTTTAPTTLIVLHPLTAVTRASVDPARLVLPAGFRNRPWHGFERVVRHPVAAPDPAARWRTIPEDSRQ
jgi:hypothetical protein